MMDKLTESLATGFSVSNDPNSTAAEHPRFSQYKEKKSGSDQQSRRQNMLLKQKSQRFDYVSHMRKLTENFFLEQPMDTTGKGPVVRQTNKAYRNQLMLSEWLVEVPEDFEEEWMMVPCPVGQRTLVVATRGDTAGYNKSGYCTVQCPSHLPSGSKKSPKKYGTTILDCIYNKITRTFYVLDLMCWNGQSVYESETDFRFYWLHTKFNEEIPEAKERSKANPYPFDLLPNFKCTRENIGEVITTNMNVELDGLLFYHKRTHYTFGSTPLVGWLKAYMLPEILGISVPRTLMDKMPQSYSTFEKHNEEVAKAKRDGVIWLGDRRKAGPRPRRSKGNGDANAMEVTATTTQKSGRSTKQRGVMEVSDASQDVKVNMVKDDISVMECAASNVSAKKDVDQDKSTD